MLNTGSFEPGSKRCRGTPRKRVVTNNSSLGHHHLHELLVVDLPIAIDVRLPDHLVDLLIRELLAEVRHHVTKLSRADEAVAIAIEHLERLDELLLSARVPH